jgi:hypothetical protein
MTVAPCVQERMGLMEETLEGWLVGQGIDKAVVHEAIGVARAEMETHKLQSLYSEFVQGDTTAGVDGAHLRTMTTMVSQLGHVQLAVEAATTPAAMAAAEAAVTAQVAAHVKGNPALVASVKDVLQQSFAGSLALSSVTSELSASPSELLASASS